jgi:hypothetical protein
VCRTLRTVIGAPSIAADRYPRLISDLAVVLPPKAMMLPTF